MNLLMLPRPLRTLDLQAPVSVYRLILFWPARHRLRCGGQPACEAAVRKNTRRETLPSTIDRSFAAVPLVHLLKTAPNDSPTCLRRPIPAAASHRVSR